jgi:type VI secretion system secreted protein Hcp
MGIYLKVPKITGDADEATHKHWIKLDSIAFESGREVYTPIGRVADRYAHRGSLGEMHLTKAMDSSSVNLFIATCASGGGTMEIVVTRAGTEPKHEIEYLKYTLEHVLFTSYSFHSSGANPYEALAINFTKIRMEYYPQDEGIKGEKPNKVQFDQKPGTGQGH